MTSMSPNEIRNKGLEALSETLGPLGMIKFLEQFEIGDGDYTKDREKWLGNLELDTIADEITEKRKK